MAHRYYSSEILVDRLCDAARRNEKPIVFLLGSALSYPDHQGGPGVLGTSALVGKIRAELGVEGIPAAPTGSPSEMYQQAFEQLLGRRGQDAVNRFIRNAVWPCINDELWPLEIRRRTANTADQVTCEGLERHHQSWQLPRATEALGRILADFQNTLGRTVLTTNFDPLIRIAIAAGGGKSYRTVLHADGSLDNTAGEDLTRIIHLHGYWHGHDTLHTPTQLLQPRPQLGRSLGRLINASTLVVLGYGGWDDVLLRTLADLLSDTGSSPEIIWAFHEDEGTVAESSQPLLALLSPGIDRGRVTLFEKIDCRALLPELRERLVSNCATVPHDEDAGDETRARVLPPQSMPVESCESDRPLLIDTWVGREDEVDLLLTSNAPVAFITGIGGQGKSALAGHVQQALEPAFEIWDWRDCREQNDRLGTQLLHIVERLSAGRILGSSLETSDIRAVVAVFFRTLGNRKAVFVFDNVDQYVDLQNLKPTKGLELLVAEAKTRLHRSRFLFTCRPDVRIDDPRVLTLPLAGLSVAETSELLMAHGISASDEGLVGKLHEHTAGHPLWVSLIAMQAVRSKGGLRYAIQILEGSHTLPETTRTIWKSLNSQQRSVLRTMTELDRPEPEDRITDLVPKVNHNRARKALKTLKSFHLVETRSGTGREPLLGLHPIIREFVRTEFTKKEREPYLIVILQFFDRMIGQFRSALSDQPAFEILEHWVRKAELQIAMGRLKEATETVDEISLPLLARGFSEEMLRVALLLFEAIDWPAACTSYKKFDDVFGRCVNQLVQEGRKEEALEWLVRYEQAIPGKSAQYIHLCDLRCYLYWFSNDFEQAVRWGAQGEQLKKDSEVDTAFSSSHNLALALRDSGEAQVALPRLLLGEDLSSVLSGEPAVVERGGEFYGNVGRCLQKSGRSLEALTCYKKCAQLLESAGERSNKLNRGYLRSWVAELKKSEGEYQAAAHCFRAACYLWADTSPPRAEIAEQALRRLVKRSPELEPCLELEDWKVETTLRRLLSLD